MEFTKKKDRIINLMTRIIGKKKSLPTGIKGVTLFQVENSFKRFPFSYNSEIILLANGKKKVYLGKYIYHYDSSHYLVLPVPIPAECEGKTENGKPILGLSIAIDPIELGELILEMEEYQKESQSLPKGIFTGKMTEELYDATLRLLQTISNSHEQKILAPMIKKEFLYRILTGENGEVLKVLAHRNKRFFQIAKILQKIHQSYSNQFDIEKLAKELDMSSATFHNSFKAVTDTSPLQYIKNIRLHKARNFMIQDGLNTTLAANRVGYESVSQFNREYKRLFGVTPAKDAMKNRIQFFPV